MGIGHGYIITLAFVAMLFGIVAATFVADWAAKLLAPKGEKR